MSPRHVRTSSKDGKAEKSEPWFSQRLELERGLEIKELRRKGAPLEKLVDIGRRIATVETGHRERLYTELGRIFAVARFLEHDDDSWLDVCSDHVWDEHARARPTFEDRSTVLATSLRLAVGLGKDNRKRVSLFKRALQGSFDRRLKPNDVPEALRKAGGPEALAREEAEATRIQELAPESLLISVPVGNLATKLAGFKPKRRVRLMLLTGETINGILQVKPLSVTRLKKG